MVQREIPRPLVQATIAADADDRRFERFVADLFSARDGIAYETTSPTGDQGVDARGAPTLVEGIAYVCATTQSSRFRAKGQSDIDKIVSLSRAVARLHICFSKSVKEETLADLVQYASEKMPRTLVEAHCLSGLTDLAFRFQRPFLDNYARDLDEQAVWLSRLLGDDEGEIDQAGNVNLLRIALTTVFNPEVIEQREMITESIIIAALSDGAKRSAADINAAAAKGLKLAQKPNDGYLLSSLRSLEQRGYVRCARGQFALTDEGFGYHDATVAKGAEASFQGREQFWRLLRGVHEAEISPQLVSRLWRAVQETFSKLFLYNGLRVVAELQAIANGEDDRLNKPEINLIPGAIRDLLIEVNNLGLDVSVAMHIADGLAKMLHDLDSDAFRWISELGAKYVVACSLGLDPEVERRIQSRVRAWAIVPDTHILLSHICPGDEGHVSCCLILSQLRSMGAALWLTQPVLEETAHHAEIADASFDHWYDRVRNARREHPEVSPTQMLGASDNAFVKGFAIVAGPAFKLTEWGVYIRQFRGRHSRDTAGLRRMLEQELGGSYKVEDSSLVQGARDFAARITRDDSRSDHAALARRTLRIEWDARLLANCVAFQESVDTPRRIIILSESDALRSMFYRRIAPEHRGTLRISDPAAIAYSLAVIPGASVNLNCMRHFLFGGIMRLPDSFATDHILGRAFNDSARVLRGPALGDRLDDVLIGDTPVVDE